MANWYQKLIGEAGVNVAEVDGDNQVLVRPARLLTKIGYVGLAGISGYTGDEGDVATAQKILASMNSRIFAGLAAPQFEDVFDATAQNTGIWKFFATTMTGAQAGGLLTLNNAGITTINTNVAMQTFRTFPLFGNNELRFSMTGGFLTGSVHVANAVTEFGIMSITGLPAATAPFDGVFFRYNAANELRGVAVNNSVETQTGALTKPTDNILHEWEIVVTNTAVQYWIDGVLQATLTLTTDAPTQTVPFQAQHPVTIRLVNGGSAPATAVKLQVGSVRVQYNGFDLDRPWPHAMAGMGRMLSQGQNGNTMGSTGLNANNANPAAAVPTNTTAALTVGLGGLAQETLTLAAATDGILNSFQVPAGTIAIPARNLVITGVTVGGVVTVALTGNPLTGTLAIAYGHTAVSLATSEAGTFVTPTTKAPRKVTIAAVGVVSSTAPVGTPVSGVPVSINFNSPIVVGPGEFIAMTHKKVTTTPSAGAIMWTICYDGYWE